MMLVDGDGQRLLSDADVDLLRNLDGADMAHLHNECSAFAGFDRDDIENLVKNSEAVSVDDAFSASQAVAEVS